MVWPEKSTAHTVETTGEGEVEGEEEEEEKEEGAEAVEKEEKKEGETVGEEGLPSAKKEFEDDKNVSVDASPH